MQSSGKPNSLAATALMHGPPTTIRFLFSSSISVSNLERTFFPAFAKLTAMSTAPITSLDLAPTPMTI